MRGVTVRRAGGDLGNFDSGIMIAAPGVTVSDCRVEDGGITHDLRTALIAPDGKLVHVWRSNAWTPEEVAGWVRELLGRPVLAASSPR